ncbi:MAG: ferritin family protein [Candidatus Omnitrophica bacterium]|nr:ferritin family protein [Candidatus Omnitrophota bacterium]
MTDFFSARDIVEFAVEIEKNGKVFYQTVAADSKDDKAKKTFQGLSDAEDEHAKVFANILRRLEPFEPKEAFNDEYFAYMKSIADEHVFTKAAKGKEIAKSTKTPQQAISIAIVFEKDSIKFYDEMKKAVIAKEHPIIDELIENEYQHLKILEDLTNQKELNDE